MSNIDLPLLLTSLTALAAVVCPVIATCVTVRSNERLRREELHAPKVYAAISQMISAFHALHRQGDHVSYSGWDLEQCQRDAKNAYTSFSSSCFEVMSLMPGETIRRQLTDLLSSLYTSGCEMSLAHEATFNQIVAGIAQELSHAPSKHDHSPDRKRKRRHRKNSSG